MVGLLATLGYALVTGLIGLVTAIVIYARWHYGTLEKVKGLPAVIKPAFIGGSDIYQYKKIVHDQDCENVKKYGKIYGYYEGRFPQIYIADPELVRLIFIKDFDHFQNKRIIDFGHELINEMMDILPYEKWKVVRSFFSPTLTTGKIRNMSVAMTESIESWMGTVKEKVENGDPFSPKRMYTALTCDVIARCGFRTKLNSLHDPNNIFVQNIKSLALEDHEINWLLTVSQMFPALSRLAPVFPLEALGFLRDVINNVMNTRSQTNVKVNDFVDSLNEMSGKLETEENKKLGITQNTVMAQALIFFIAGFETTSATLSYLTYNLATNPAIQDKLVAEVDAYLARHDGKIQHETIGELVYMSACIQESLRMYPPLTRVERVCNKDWHDESTGLHIPEGVTVQVPIQAIHYNEEYYPEPHTFRPERFLAENKDQIKTYAFLSFGLGNHNCIGMRFAKEEILLTMANVLKNFTFKPNSGTKVKFLPGRTFVFSSEPFTVDVIKRAK